MNSNSIKKIIASVLALSMIFITSSMITQTPKSVQAYDQINIDKNLNGEIIVKNEEEEEEEEEIKLIPNIFTYDGTDAIAIPIPNGIKIKDADDVKIIGYDRDDDYYYEDIRQTIVDDHIVISGLRPGINYDNLSLKLEDIYDVEYRYNVNPFVFTPSKPSTPIRPNVPTTNQPETPNMKKELTLYLSNVYQNVFNRTIDNQGSEYWSQKLMEDSIRLKNLFKNLLSENEFKQVAPTVEDKIKKLYTGIFQRQPDVDGFLYWVNRYKQEAIMQNSENGALLTVIDNMTNSSEFMSILNKLKLRA